MTKEEMLHLFRKVKIKWPNFQLDADLDFMAEVYLEDYGEFTYEQVDRAYRSFKKHPFAPTISEVLDALAPPDIGEAWMVRKAGTMGMFEKDNPLA